MRIRQIKVILLFVISLNCHSQTENECLLHVIDTSYHSNNDSLVVKHKLLIKSENDYIEILEVLNYFDNFNFICNFPDSSNSNYFVFCNYGSAAGIFKLYFIEPKSKLIFESSSIFEFEIPLYTSFNNRSLEIRLISFRDGNCGIYISKKVNLYNNFKIIKHNDNYKIVRSIICN